MNIRQETITPEKAREYLGMNTNNYRTVNKSRVDSYAADMVSGRWQFNGETIKFNSKGELVDGQHRLNAIVKANIPVNMIIVTDCEADVFDIGQSRSLGQLAKHRTKYGAIANTTVAAANCICNNMDSHTYSGRVTVLDYIEEHQEWLNKATTLVVYGKSPICKKSPIIVAAYCLLRKDIDYSEMDDFFKIANSGLPIGYHNPSSALVFRNMVQKIKCQNVDERKLIFSACVSAVDDFINNRDRKLAYQFNLKAYELLHEIRLEDGLCSK